jgi:beta-phosphoglucomutase-like phosphatase (HAD superfamily)
MAKSQDKVMAILWDLDGTLLDTEALSDKAVLLAFGPSLPRNVLQETPPMSNGRLPWELKKKILGLRGEEWAPIVLLHAKEKWGVTDEMAPPTP